MGPSKKNCFKISSVAEPKLFIFGSSSDFGHNSGSGYSHILALNPLVPEIFFCEFFEENLGASSYWIQNKVRIT